MKMCWRGTRHPSASLTRCFIMSCVRVGEMYPARFHNARSPHPFQRWLAKSRHKACLSCNFAWIPGRTVATTRQFVRPLCVSPGGALRTSIKTTLTGRARFKVVDVSAFRWTSGVCDRRVDPRCGGHRAAMISLYLNANTRCELGRLSWNALMSWAPGPSMNRRL